MDPSLTPPELSLILCGLIVALGPLLVWAIQIGDRWVRMVRVRRNRD